jgi:hypothetical protein
MARMATQGQGGLANYQQVKTARRQTTVAASVLGSMYGQVVGSPRETRRPIR